MYKINIIMDCFKVFKNKKYGKSQKQSVKEDNRVNEIEPSFMIQLRSD